MIRILHIELIVSETVDERQRYVSQYKCPETEVVITSLPDGSGHLEHYSYGALVVPKLIKS